MSERRALPRFLDVKAVGGLLAVCSLIAALGTVILGNDVGLALAEGGSARSAALRGFVMYVVAPLTGIALCAAVCTQAGVHRPLPLFSFAVAAVAVAAGFAVGRLVWRFVEVQSLGLDRGLLDTTATGILLASVLGGTGIGIIVGELAGAVNGDEWVRRFSVVGAALVTFPIVELFANTQRISALAMWLMAAFLGVLSIMSRIGLGPVDDDLDDSAAIRMVMGFVAAWSVSMVTALTGGSSFEGQGLRFGLIWVVPVILAAPSVVAGVDRRLSRKLTQA